MKANEFRLGNLIQVAEVDLDKGGEKIDAIEVDRYVLEEIIRGNPCERFSIIPLTEEWLLKFGIIFKGYDDDNDKIFSDGTEPWFEELEGGFYLQEYGKRIEYVHQLQNLYFALTGEELTIK